jgi:DNA-binding IclR family transcriptional regulator
VRLRGGGGQRDLLYCANGKALSPSTRSPWHGSSAPASSGAPPTLRGSSTCWKELKVVRKTGVAFDREEHTLGCAAV